MAKFALELNNSAVASQLKIVSRRVLSTCSHIIQGFPISTIITRTLPMRMCAASGIGVRAEAAAGKGGAPHVIVAGVHVRVADVGARPGEAVPDAVATSPHGAHRAADAEAARVASVACETAAAARPQ